MIIMIEEARNRVIDMFCNLRNGYIDHLTYGGKGDAETEADIHALEEVIAALDWYIDQDLIQRKAVAHCILQDCNDCGYRMYRKIEKIPKAEPKYSGCGYDIFCEKIDCKGCEAEPKTKYIGDDNGD